MDAKVHVTIYLLYSHVPWNLNQEIAPELLKTRTTDPAHFII